MGLRSLLGAGVVTAFGSMALLSPVSAQTPFRIGVIEDMSGPYADNGGKGTTVAAQMAVDDFGGKVLDRPIEIVSADHQNKADIAVAKAREWYTSQNVNMITGLGNSAVALAVRNLARGLGKVDIVSSAASSDITAKECSPTGFHWVYDSYALGKTIATAAVKAGGNKWFFLTADYNYGIAAQRDATQFVEKAGGAVVGSVRVPLNSSDLSSFMLTAQGSPANIVGMAMSGSDLTNAIKTASEFGLVQGGKKMVGLLIFINDIYSLGLKTAQGLLLAESFYWDLDDETRAWSKRYFDKMGRMPTMTQAGTYSAVNHYLKAVKAAGTDEGKIVAQKMRDTPINDFMSKDVKIRADGRDMRPMYLFEVKAPSESKGPWDLYKKIDVVPGEEAFRPLSEGTCALAK